MICQGKDKSMVFNILFTAVRNLGVLSSDRVEFMEHWGSLQISGNKEQTENIKGAPKPVGS